MSFCKKICAVILIGMFVFAGGCSEDNSEINEVLTEPEKIDETISIFALGDNLLHMPVVNSGKQKDGSYEYSHLFEKLQPQIEEADIAVIGQETVFGGEKLGYSGYPLFNSPSDMGVTLANEGFDVVLHASNHVMDKGTKGIRNTMKFWDDYPEVTVLGINEDEEEWENVRIKTVKGAKLALLNYTYSTNGITVPEDEEYIVNVIDEDKIESDALYAEENADFTIAFMHWGTEYSTKPDSDQQELSEKMCEWGVDLIIGSHPHVIEPVEWVESDNGNRMLVYYSLGNYVSRQLEAINLLGGVADVKLKFDGYSVEIDDYSFMPIVTHYDTTYTGFSVYPLKDYDDNTAAKHGVAAHNGAVSVERFEKLVDKVFDGYDECPIDY